MAAAPKSIGVALEKVRGPLRRLFSESRTTPDRLVPREQPRAGSGFVSLSAGVTHYSLIGPIAGPVVVLVHGFSVPAYVWERNSVALAVSGLRVLRYDLYGRGLSDRPSVDYDPQLFVNQLRELLQALGLKDPVNLVGSSMGGMVVAAFASQYPEQVHRIALISPFNQRRELGALRIPWVGECLARAFWLPRMAEQQLGDFHHPERFPDWPARFKVQMKLPGFGRALLSSARHSLGKDPSPHFRALAQTGIPIRLLWGRQDRVVGTSGAQTLGRLLDAPVIWFEATGHLPHVERAEAVNAELIRFFCAEDISGIRRIRRPASRASELGQSQEPDPA